MGIKVIDHIHLLEDMTGSDFEEITKSTPEKSLVTSLKKELVVTTKVR